MSDAILAGIGPVMLFSVRLNPVKLTRFPREEGIDPVRLLELKCKVVKVDNPF